MCQYRICERFIAVTILQDVPQMRYHVSSWHWIYYNENSNRRERDMAWEVNTGEEWLIRERGRITATKSFRRVWESVCNTVTIDLAKHAVSGRDLVKCLPLITVCSISVAYTNPDTLPDSSRLPPLTTPYKSLFKSNRAINLFSVGFLRFFQLFSYL